MARVRQLIFCGCCLLLIVMFAPRAHAKVYPDQGAAYAGCQAAGGQASGDKSRWATGAYRCDPYPPTRYECLYEARVSSPTSDPYYIPCGNFVSDGTDHVYPSDKSCASRSPFTSTFSPKNGSIGCSEGCETLWNRNGDGTSTAQYIGTMCTNKELPTKCGKGYYWNAVLNVCEPVKDECPEGKTMNTLGQCAPEPCPDGMLQQQDGTCKAKESECAQGQVKGPDGSCVKKPDACGSGQAQGDDGTCKPDKDGDGKPDNNDSDGDGKDDKSSFAGGDSCSAPPACSGDPILCGQARIQWRIDCNTRRNRNISGGSCGAMPVCTGEKCDAMEYASLLMQWRTACATEKLAGKGTDNAGAQPEWTKVTGMSQDAGKGASASDTKVLTSIKLSTDDLDKSGFGAGVGTCIGFATGGGGGQLADGFLATLASPPAIFCDWVKTMSAICILGASIVSAIILSRGGA